MSIVYDLLGVQSKEHGERGIARYVLNLALALEHLDQTLIDIFLVREYLPIPGVLEPLVRSGKVRTMQELDRDPPESGVFFVASPYELGEGLDSLVPGWARRPEWKRVGVVYDLIPMIFPEVYLNDFWAQRYEARTKTLASFDHLFAISEASKEDAVRLLNYDPDSITMIAAGADARFTSPTVPTAEIASDLATRIPNLRPEYLLFPSGIEWRKNIDRLLEAYGRLPLATRKAHQLVMVCRTNEQERHLLAEKTALYGISEDFVATGFVGDDDLVRLYQAASLVIFPSLYEGFGLPVLEARRCGAPAICSDSSSLKEVQPDPSARFDPFDVGAIEEVLKRTLGNQTELHRLRSAQIPPFTWEWGAERVAAALRKLDAPKQPKKKRRRLAIVTPLPPCRSGIATYAHRMISPMAAEADITVFVEEEDLSQIDCPPGVRVMNVSHWRTIERIEGRFEEVLYFMGNSEFHVESLEMLRQRPGVVLMHDARMTGLYEMQFELARHRLPSGTVGGFLRKWYPLNYQPALYEKSVILAPEADRFGILLCREIVNHATRVLTHSQFAASLIRLDTGRAVEVAFPIPVASLDDANSLGPPEEADILVTTFGHVDPVKQPGLLIDAMAILSETYPTARLRFVGQADPHQQKHLDELTERAGLCGSVEVTGRLSDTEYSHALREATIAVQLRAFTNGESSAAVADLIGSGVPVVVTGIGAMTELPPEIVEFVSPLDGATELANCLLRLLGDPGRRRSMIENGRRYAIENSYENASARLHQILFGSEASQDRAEPSTRLQDGALEHAPKAIDGDHQAGLRAISA